jgi:hypothetical protein
VRLVVVILVCPSEAWRYPSPGVAHCGAVVSLQLALLFADKTPYFIKLDIGAFEVAFFVQEASAALTYSETETHYCVAMNPGHSSIARMLQLSASAAMIVICLSVLTIADSQQLFSYYKYLPPRN